MLTDEDVEVVTFTVVCTMRRRWARQFLHMLQTMQVLGSIGSSREVRFCSDGDGDYRPKFDHDSPDGPVPLSSPIYPEKDIKLAFDAG